MKKILSALIIGATASAVSVTAVAQDSSTYINVGVDTFDFDAHGIGGKLGYEFSENFAIEGQGSIGLIDDEVEEFGVTADVGYDYLAGVFGVAKLPTGQGFEPFVRAGYYFAKLSASANGVSDSISTDSFAIGGGAQYMWDGVNGVRGEYAYLDGENGGSADTFSLAYVRKF